LATLYNDVVLTAVEVPVGAATVILPAHVNVLLVAAKQPVSPGRAARMRKRPVAFILNE
jgi:hypothetical protein